MKKSQFFILARKMRAGALRSAAFMVMVHGLRQCEVLSVYPDVSKQSLHQAIKRLKKRAAEFEAMGKLKL